MYQCCKCQAKFDKLQLLTRHLVEKCVTKTPSPLKKLEEDYEECKPVKAKRFIQPPSILTPFGKKKMKKEGRDSEELGVKSLVNIEEKLGAKHMEKLEHSNKPININKIEDGLVDNGTIEKIENNRSIHDVAQPTDIIKIEGGVDDNKSIEKIEDNGSIHDVAQPTDIIKIEGGVDDNKTIEKIEDNGSIGDVAQPVNLNKIEDGREDNKSIGTIIVNRSIDDVAQPIDVIEIENSFNVNEKIEKIDENKSKDDVMQPIDVTEIGNDLEKNKTIEKIECDRSIHAVAQPTDIIKIEDGLDNNKTIEDNGSIGDVALPVNINKIEDGREDNETVEKIIGNRSIDDVVQPNDVIKIEDDLDVNKTIEKIDGNKSKDDVVQPIDVIEIGSGLGKNKTIEKIEGDRSIEEGAEKMCVEEIREENVKDIKRSIAVNKDYSYKKTCIEATAEELIKNNRSVGSFKIDGVDEKKCIENNKNSEEIAEERANDDTKVNVVMRSTDIIKIEDYCAEGSTITGDVTKPIEKTSTEGNKSREEIVEECTKDNRSVDDVAHPTGIIKIENDDEKVCIEGSETHEEIAEECTKIDTGIIKIEDNDEKTCIERSEAREEVAEERSKNTTKINKLAQPTDSRRDRVEENDDKRNCNEIHEENATQLKQNVAGNIDAADVRIEDISDDTVENKNDAHQMESPEENISKKACNFCNELFSFNFQLKKHKLKNCKLFSAHRKKFSSSLASKNICKNCSLKFTNADALRTHMLVYCKLYKYQKTFVPTVKIKKKPTKAIIKKVTDTALCKEEETVAQPISKIQGIPQEKVVQSAFPEPKSGTQTSQNEKIIAKYCAKHCICDICYSPFYNFAALATHKKFYCKRFGGSTKKQEEDAAKTKALKSAKTRDKLSNVVSNGAGKEDAKGNAIQVYGAVETNSSTERENKEEPQEKISCDQCGTVFRFICELVSHQGRSCTKGKPESKPASPKKDKQMEKVQEKKLQKKKPLICPYCNGGFKTESDLSTHKMLYCKEMNKKTLLALNLGQKDSDNSKDAKATSESAKEVEKSEPKPQEGGQTQQVVCHICGSDFYFQSALELHQSKYCKVFQAPKGNTSKDLDKTIVKGKVDDVKTTLPITKKEETPEKGLENVDETVIVNDAKRPKSPVTAPVKDPDEDNNTCNICGCQFEFSFALQKHKTLYCKSFLSPKSGKECGSGGDPLKFTESNDLSNIMHNEVESETNIVVEKEQAAKKKESKPKKIETGDYKCETCNATFKYEVDLSWHKYKSKYNSCAENIGASADDAKPKEKPKDTKASRTYLVSNTFTKTDVEKIQPQPKVEERSGIPTVKEIYYKSRADEDCRRRVFDLRDTLKRKSQSGSEPKRCRSRSFENDTVNLPSTSKRYSKRYESSRERSAEKTEMLPSSSSSMPKRKRLTYEIMEADSSSDKRKKASKAKKSSSRKKASDSDDSTEEPAVAPSPPRLHHKRLKRLKSSIFCEQCGARLSNAAEVHKPTCGHHRTSFPCAVCKNNFPNINTLIRHQDEEHQTDEVIMKEMEKADKHTMVKYFCCLCGIDFNFIKNLIYHKVSEHKFFHRMFSKDDAAPIIKPVNHNLEGFACVFCDQMLFSSLKDLFDHEDKSKRHKKNEKKFKQLKSNYNPIEHQRFVHVCYVCNLGFISFKDQQIHMLDSPEHYKLERKRSDMSKDDLLRLDKKLAKYSQLKSKYLQEEARMKKSRPTAVVDIQSNDLYKKVANILNYDAESIVSSSRTDSSNFLTRSQSPDSMIPVIDLSSGEAYPSTSGSSLKRFDQIQQHYQQNSGNYQFGLTDDRFGGFKEGKQLLKAEASSDEEIELVKTYQCYICSENFDSLDDLDKHSCAGPF